MPDSFLVGGRNNESTLSGRTMGHKRQIGCNVDTHTVDGCLLVDTFICQDTKLEHHLLLDWQPGQIVEHRLGDTGERRKPQYETGGGSLNRLQRVDQAPWSVGQDAITIV